MHRKKRAVSAVQSRRSRHGPIFVRPNLFRFVPRNGTTRLSVEAFVIDVGGVLKDRQIKGHNFGVFGG